MEAPQAIREMADKGIMQAKESYAKMHADTAEASNIIQNACSTAAQGAMACNAKVIEFARANTSDHHARKQFEILSEQTKELTALSQKMMLETAEPLKAGAVKAFGSHLG